MDGSPKPERELAVALVAWRGPSELTGEPVFVAVGNLDRSSQVSKLGDVVQVTFMPDVPERPHVVARHRETRSVCGDCAFAPHMEGGCYVLLFRGPQAFHTTAFGRDPTPLEILGRVARRGVPIRFGMWGDPAAVPVSAYAFLLAWAKATGAGWLGYTHQWRTRPHLRAHLMASVDSPAERTEAKALGWRTYRSRWPWEPVEQGEFVCPASFEGRHRSTCAKCLQCSGTEGRGVKDPTIIRHDGKSLHEMVRVSEDPEDTRAEAARDYLARRK